MGYQGFRFYCNSTDSTAACCCCTAGLLFSVGKGDANTRVHCGTFYSCNRIDSPIICATGASGYTLRTAGCIYSNSTIVAAGDVYGVSVCATNYVQATNYVYAAGSRLGSSNLFCGATCIHADADSKITFKNAGTNAIAMYADAGDELYLASNNAASGTVRIPSAGGIDASSGCIKGPIVCATSCVYVGDNIKIQQGIGCSIVNDAADYWRWTLAGGNNRFYWHTNTADRMCLNENGQLCTTGAMCSAIVCATTCVDANVVYVCGSGKIGALTCSKSYFNTFGGTPGFLGGDTKHEMRVMNSAGSTNTGYVRFTTDSSANFGISVATCSSTTHRLCITTAGVVTAPHCFTTPISCATTCFSLSSGSNVTKICNSVGFTVVDSTEGLLVRDNSANVMEIRASGTKSYCNFNVCGSLSKASGCFSIPHPDPSKNSTHNLQHSFVESPTEGDNIYRWQVDTSNCASVITLPSYYRHLNKNDMVWVSPYKNFGAAYGEVTADQCCLIVCSNQDGCYNVLLIGTRKDEHAENTWTGPEVLKPTSSETGVPTPVHSSQL